MEPRPAPSTWNAAVFGLLAGAILVVFEILVALIVGDGATRPLRQYASVVLQEDALTHSAPGIAVAVGLAVHLAVSAAWAVLFRLLGGGFGPGVQVSWAYQLLAGAVLGFVVYFIDYQIIGRLAFPWLLEQDQLTALVLRVLFYGMPLGTLFFFGTRRDKSIVLTASKGTHSST